MSNSKNSSAVNVITMKAARADDRWFSLLEKRGLITLLKPTAKIMRSTRGRGAVDVVYSCARQFGTHTLICVKPDSAVPWLNYHPDNEEFILIDTRKGVVRPLYMLIGLSKQQVLREKARRGTLSEKDFAFLKMPFNRAENCVFTMCKDTAHCEIVFPGPGEAPVFFVTEPRRLPLRLLKLPGHTFRFRART